MFLDFKTNQDKLNLIVMIGAGESYSPKKYKKVLELHKEIKELDIQIQEMRDKINPKLAEIKAKVSEFNEQHNKKYTKTEEN